MKRSDTAVLVHGAIGGLTAGALVALWFLVLDLTINQPFRTPEALARLFLADDAAIGGIRLTLGYTVLHLGVYAALGVAVALLMRAVNVAPGLLLGLVIGVGLLNVMHYGALLVTGSGVLTALPPLQVLAANLSAGLAMVTYFHLALTPNAPFGLSALMRHERISQGLVTGLVGAGVVAVWFLVVDAMRGEPFFTPAALGSAVFLGATGADQVQVTAGVIAAYTVLHFAAFGLVGIGFVVVAEWLERSPGMWLMAFIGFVLLEGLFLVTATSLGAWLLGAVSWWAIGIGNLASVVAMGRWVWRTHPDLRRQLSRPVRTHV